MFSQVSPLKDPHLCLNQRHTEQVSALLFAPALTSRNFFPGDISNAPSLERLAEPTHHLE